MNTEVYLIFRKNKNYFYLIRNILMKLGFEDKFVFEFELRQIKKDILSKIKKDI